jgi:hypothetical protein
MKRILTVLFVVLSLRSLSAQALTQMAICREDNDFCTYLDTVSARKTIPLNVVVYFKNYYSMDTSNIDQIFEIKFNPYSLFVVHLAKLVGWDEEYHFWVYDSCSNSFSSHPYVIKGQWMSNQEEGFDVKLLSYPLVHEKHGEVWIKERVHNGNTYNAVIKHKVLCDKKLNLKLTACIEEVSQCHFPWMAPDGYALVYREQQGNDVICTINISGKREVIGSYCLSKKGKISKIKVLDNRYSHLIVTSSGLRPNAFMRFYFKQNKR